MTIIEPERLSAERLRRLASAAPPCISIVLVEQEARDARIAFKDALAKVRGMLETRVPKHDIASFLDPIESAAKHLIDSSNRPATFIFPALARCVRVVSHALSRRPAYRHSWRELPVWRAAGPCQQATGVLHPVFKAE